MYGSYYNLKVHLENYLSIGQIMQASNEDLIIFDLYVPWSINRKSKQRYRKIRITCDYTSMLLNCKRSKMTNVTLNRTYDTHVCINSDYLPLTYFQENVSFSS